MNKNGLDDGEKGKVASYYQWNVIGFKLPTWYLVPKNSYAEISIAESQVVLNKWKTSKYAISSATNTFMKDIIRCEFLSKILNKFQRSCHSCVVEKGIIFI